MSEENQNSNESKGNWSNRELGALWLRQGKNQKYLTGYIESDDFGSEKKRIIVFKKRDKPTDRAPDYVIYESEEYKGEKSSESTQSKQSSSQSKEEADNIPSF